MLLSNYRGGDKGGAAYGAGDQQDACLRREGDLGGQGWC